MLLLACIVCTSSKEISPFISFPEEVRLSLLSNELLAGPALLHYRILIIYRIFHLPQHMTHMFPLLSSLGPSSASSMPVPNLKPLQLSW